MLSRELIASGRTLQCTPWQARSSAAPSLSPALDHARPAIERLSGWSIVANTSFNVKARPMINRCGKERRIGSDLFGVRCGAEAHCANAVHGRCCAVCTDARVSCCATGHQCLFVCLLGCWLQRARCDRAAVHCRRTRRARRRQRSLAVQWQHARLLAGRWHRLAVHRLSARLAGNAARHRRSRLWQMSLPFGRAKSCGVHGMFVSVPVSSCILPCHRPS
jgi:hypothetical protein